MPPGFMNANWAPAGLRVRALRVGDDVAERGLAIGVAVLVMLAVI